MRRQQHRTPTLHSKAKLLNSGSNPAAHRKHFKATWLLPRWLLAPRVNEVISTVISIPSKQVQTPSLRQLWQGKTATKVANNSGRTTISQGFTMSLPLLGGTATSGTSKAPARQHSTPAKQQIMGSPPRQTQQQHLPEQQHSMVAMAGNLQ